MEGTGDDDDDSTGWYRAAGATAVPADGGAVRWREDAPPPPAAAAAAAAEAAAVASMSSRRRARKSRRMAATVGAVSGSRCKWWPPRMWWCSMSATLAMRCIMSPAIHGHPCVPVTHSVGQRTLRRKVVICASDRYVGDGSMSRVSWINRTLGGASGAPPSPTATVPRSTSAAAAPYEMNCVPG